MEENVASSQGTTWFQDAMKKGVILGIIHVFLFVLVYYLAPNKLTGFSYLFAIIAINLGYIIYQGIQWRKEIGGYIGFGDAFKYAFIVFLFNGLLGTVFSLIFLFIEPSLPEIYAQAQLDTSIYWAKTMGAPENALDEMREKFNPEDITKRFSPLGHLTGLGIVSIFYAVGALIIALFVKKNEPEVV
jgi:hypothetical protein